MDFFKPPCPFLPFQNGPIARSIEVAMAMAIGFRSVHGYRHLTITGDMVQAVRLRKCGVARAQFPAKVARKVKSSDAHCCILVCAASAEIALSGFCNLCL